MRSPCSASWESRPSRWVASGAIQYTHRRIGRALSIVGLLSFLLGIVVAYQGADQLRQYGANIYVTDLVGLSMLRDFAPLMTAIIIAGRSGPAYAAQNGTMAVTQEIDAMRTPWAFRHWRCWCCRNSLRWSLPCPYSPCLPMC